MKHISNPESLSDTSQDLGLSHNGNGYRESGWGLKRKLRVFKIEFISQKHVSHTALEKKVLLPKVRFKYSLTGRIRSNVASVRRW